MVGSSMRILQIGDIHCDIRFLKKLAKLEVNPDLLAVHGDVECNGEIIDYLERISRRIIFVPGNMDDVYVSKLYGERGYNIDGEVRKIGSYYFCGIGGISPVTSIQSLKTKLEKIKHEVLGGLVILSHHPPRTAKTDLALGRIHAGLREINKLIEEYKPLLVMHGHIHEARGYEHLGETLVVNAGSLRRGYYALIELPDRKVELKQIRL